ncbi:MAG: hypothetical protein ABEN55_16340 [Bradymonadaceae bacterium]
MRKDKDPEGGQPEPTNRWKGRQEASNETEENRGPYGCLDETDRKIESAEERNDVFFETPDGVTRGFVPVEFEGVVGKTQVRPPCC